MKYTVDTINKTIEFEGELTSSEVKSLLKKYEGYKLVTMPNYPTYEINCGTDLFKKLETVFDNCTQ